MIDAGLDQWSKRWLGLEDQAGGGDSDAALAQQAGVGYAEGGRFAPDQGQPPESTPTEAGSVLGPSAGAESPVDIEQRVAATRQPPDSDVVLAQQAGTGPVARAGWPFPGEAPPEAPNIPGRARATPVESAVSALNQAGQAVGGFTQELTTEAEQQDARLNELLGIKLDQPEYWDAHPELAQEYVDIAARRGAGLQMGGVERIEGAGGPVRRAVDFIRSALSREPTSVGRRAEASVQPIGEAVQGAISSVVPEEQRAGLLQAAQDVGGLLGPEIGMIRNVGPGSARALRDEIERLVTERPQGWQEQITKLGDDLSSLLRQPSEASRPVHGAVEVARPTEIPRFGYAGNVSPEAEVALRQSSVENTPERVLPRAEVAQRAEQILSLEPGTLKGWQERTLAEGTETAAVKGETLREAAYADQEHAVQAARDLQDAQRRLSQNAAAGLQPGDAEKLQSVQAAYDAAIAAAKLSAKATTAEGTATARALAQRQWRVQAAASYEISERARAVAEAAQQADAAITEATRNGSLTDSAQQKLADALGSISSNGHVLGADGEQTAISALGGIDRTAEQVGGLQKTVQAARTAAQEAGGLPSYGASALTGAAAGGAGEQARAEQQEGRPATLAELARGITLGAVAGLGARKLGGEAVIGLGVRPIGQVAEKAAPTVRELEAVSQQGAQVAERAATQGIEQARIRSVVEQIKQVLDNPNAPDALDRLAGLHADLNDISQAGFERSSQIRQALYKRNLLREGMAGPGSDVTPIVQALARIQGTPAERQAQLASLVKILSKPRLIDYVQEYQYVNMLSSILTQGANIGSNALQLAGRLFLQNPLENVLGGSAYGGTGAALRGAVKGFQEGASEFGEIMRTGQPARQVERTMALRDLGAVPREFLTEKFGPIGTVLHVMSTRPLEAFDALFGRMNYASVIEQEATRKADALLKSGAMTGDRASVVRDIMANIWDYPDIVKKAGKIQDYTLLRSVDKSPIEDRLRQWANLRTVKPDATLGDQAIAFMANMALPFFGVPLNVAKQGIERTVGVPYNIAKGVATGDPERVARGLIGASGLALATSLVLDDNLTADGPTDQAQRNVWNQNHRPWSFRVPGTGQWIDYRQLPIALPFGMVAGGAESYREAQQKAAAKQESPAGTIAAGVVGGVRGTVAAFVNNSFVQGLTNVYQTLLGEQTGPGGLAMTAAGTAGRFIPASGMLGLAARVGDQVERETDRARQYSEIPMQAWQQLESRTPGLRQNVPVKTNLFGEPVQSQGTAQLAPYYRGPAPLEGNAQIAKLEAAGIGVPAPPSQIMLPSGAKIPLNASERRDFKNFEGRALHEALNAGDLRPGELTTPQYTRARDAARASAERQIIGQIGRDELLRRVNATKAAS